MKKMSWGLLCVFLLSGCTLHENAKNVSVNQPEQYQEVILVEEEKKVL